MQDGVPDCSTRINVDSMSSAGDLQVCNQSRLKTHNHRLYNRWLHSLPCLTLEHAKVLLPQIIPKAIAENGSKIRLFLLFFGANDASLKGAPQHVFSSSLFLILGPIRNLCVKSSGTSKITSSSRTQSRHQTPPNHPPSNLFISLCRARSRIRSWTRTYGRTHSSLCRKS